MYPGSNYISRNVEGDKKHGKAKTYSIAIVPHGGFDEDKIKEKP